MTYPLTANQQLIFDLCEKSGENILITGPPGCGKCLGGGTKVMMYDGGFKKAEEVEVGDLLMGPDSKPRKVLELSSGVDDMYEVVQNQAMNYVVNTNHILSLRRNPGRPLLKGKMKRGKWTQVKNYPEYHKVANIRIGEFIGKSATFKRTFSGYKVSVDYSEKPLEIDPYFLGLWLGDGHSRVPHITTMDKPIVDWLTEYSLSIGHILSKQTANGQGKASTYLIKNIVRKNGDRLSQNTLRSKMRKLNLIQNKHIPWDYLYNSKENRLKLLAGLVDTDGYFYTGQYELVQVRKDLLGQIKILCDGLGFKTRITEKIINEVTYYRLFFSSNIPIPVLLERKKNTNRRNKDHSVTRIDEINFVGKGEYYGFSVDGDHLFCLEDGTVTHNSVLNNALLERGKKKWVMSAPTGLAAINVQGRTLHSLFRIPTSEGVIVPEYNVFNRDLLTGIRLRALKTLIIDEISMVRVDVFEYIDRMLRFVKGVDRPFGGVQVVAVGDFYQLPPVVRRGDDLSRWGSPYVFSSEVFESFRHVRLTEVLRQKGDNRFIEILHAARSGRLSLADVHDLNARVGRPAEGIRLVAVNKQADDINQTFLQSLPGRELMYEAQVFGEWPADPVERSIRLRTGAQVMVRLNKSDEEGKVVNGTIGKVVAMEDKAVVIESGSEVHKISRRQFQRKIKDYSSGEWEEKIVASFDQMPVVLAWAVSMHKSQGQSFDQAHVDLSRVFAPGQAYVALSRVRSLVGLSLEAPIQAEHLWPDEKVVEWDKQMV